MTLSQPNQTQAAQTALIALVEHLRQFAPQYGNAGAIALRRIEEGAVQSVRAVRVELVHVQAELGTVKACGEFAAKNALAQGLGFQVGWI